jgi:SagB-type dehydrogenase family enzyme
MVAMPRNEHFEREMNTSARTRQLFVRSILLAVLLTSCQRSKPTDRPTTPTASAQANEIPLSAPLTKGPLSLEEALSRRSSVRAYADRPLSLDDIAQLFWAAQGVTRPWGGRTAPSAGALYPLEIYAATAQGVYHYLPAAHRAEVTLQEDIRQALWEAGLRQEALRQASAIFVVTAVYDRTAGKYGARAERYVKLEAGHAAQNLLLQAVALDLGAVPIGAFHDEEVAAALRRTAEEEPLYLIPVGHPSD